MKTPDLQEAVHPLMENIDNSYALIENEDLMHTQSTSQIRSILSAYSELTGFLGMQEGKSQVKQLTAEQRKAAKDTPFQLRRKEQIDV